MTVSRCATHTDLNSVLCYLLPISLLHRLVVKIYYFVYVVASSCKLTLLQIKHWMQNSTFSIISILQTLKVQVQSKTQSENLHIQEEWDKRDAFSDT